MLKFLTHWWWLLVLIAVAVGFLWVGWWTWRNIPDKDKDWNG